MEQPTESTSTSALASSAEDLSPLEQDVLDEYERLAENMKKVGVPSLPPPLLNVRDRENVHVLTSFDYLSWRVFSTRWPANRRPRSWTGCDSWSARRVWCLRCSRRAFIALCCSRRSIRGIRLGMMGEGEEWGSGKEYRGEWRCSSTYSGCAEELGKEEILGLPVTFRF